MDTYEEKRRSLLVDESDKHAASEGSEQNYKPKKGSKRRHATVYDAVAGELSP